MLVRQDVQWSKQEEMQVIDCLWRRPQAKRVVVYRLLARRSPDDFLTNISSAKSAMRRVFLDQAHPALRKHKPILMFIMHLLIIHPMIDRESIIQFRYSS